MDRLGELFDPTRFDREIIPMLLESGVDPAEIEALVVDNPRRFFTGEPLPTG
jgi:predicted metal-dependent phosphotriesterase family hydrolase